MATTKNKATLGFRAWKISPKGLHPLTARGNWTRGVNVSVCQGGRHKSPHPECHCGFNAWFQVNQSLKYSGYLNSQAVHGAIAGAGRTEIHQKHGFRSEEAQILALWLNFVQIEKNEGTKGIMNAVHNIQFLQNMYRVPVFLNFSDFQEYVDSFDLEKVGNPFQLPKDLAKELENEISQFQGGHFQNGKNEIFFNKQGQIHRTNGPAISLSNGTEKWYQNGVLHREDGPALSTPSGQEWWWRGKRHRLGDAAVIRLGHKEWWENGERHRGGDFPAVVSKKNGEEWWVEGKRHREGRKPAIIFANGSKEYWQDDKKVLSSEASIYITDNGDIEWKVDGILHRDGDMPAVERLNGDKEWWQFGERHRDKNLPAVVVERDSRVLRYEYWQKDTFVKSETKVIKDKNDKAAETKARLGLL